MTRTELQQLKMTELAQWFDENCFEFGDIPRYSAGSTWKYIYVCKNNGAFHRGNRINCPGFASYMGRYTKPEIIELIYIWHLGEV
jgi:carotenoid cleavage dioxygenase-like enzyme